MEYVYKPTTRLREVVGDWRRRCSGAGESASCIDICESARAETGCSCDNISHLSIEAVGAQYVNTCRYNRYKGQRLKTLKPIIFNANKNRDGVV